MNGTGSGMNHVSTARSSRNIVPDSSAAARVTTAASWLAERGVVDPMGMIVLGSGWAPLIERVEVLGRWPYSEIPGLPSCSVKGHPGDLVYGRWDGVPLIVFVGRWHAYEGRTPEDLALPPRIAKALGARWMLGTNAAGGIDSNLRVGDLVAVTDDLSFWATGRAMQVSGIVGDTPQHSGAPYSQRLVDALLRAAEDVGISLHRGTLAMMTGANYEAAAEIAMLRFAGASVVSMSTLPEVR
ncbi:MAG TPA: hypothetical protein ENN56_01505, partial [Firmicutes bacterium]|nr:hypothetical protein [Bacillota bacterium]